MRFHVAAGGIATYDVIGRKRDDPYESPGRHVWRFRKVQLRTVPTTDPWPVTINDPEYGGIYTRDIISIDLVVASPEAEAELEPGAVYLVTIEKVER